MSHRPFRSFHSFQPNTHVFKKLWEGRKTKGREKEKRKRKDRMKQRKETKKKKRESRQIEKKGKKISILLLCS